MQHQHPCFFCLSSSSVVVKMDKRGRPYASCIACNARTFCPTPQALRGFKLFGETLFAQVRALVAPRIPQADASIFDAAAQVREAV